VLKLIVQFGAVLFKHWWALLSCAVFTVFGVFAMMTKLPNEAVVKGSFGLALALFIVAAFLAWKSEHESYLSEVAKNERPELSGEAYGFSASYDARPLYDADVLNARFDIDGTDDDSGVLKANLYFNLYLYNQRDVPTLIRSIQLDGSKLTPPLEFDIWPPRNDFLGELELSYSIGKTVDVSGTVLVSGFKSLGDVPSISLDGIGIRVEDSFQQWHAIGVRTGESIAFIGCI
jgi:hypothetical protein